MERLVDGFNAIENNEEYSYNDSLGDAFATAFYILLALARLGILCLAAALGVCCISTFYGIKKCCFDNARPDADQYHNEVAIELNNISETPEGKDTDLEQNSTKDGFEAKMVGESV